MVLLFECGEFIGESDEIICIVFVVVGGGSFDFRFGVEAVVEILLQIFEFVGPIAEFGA